MPVYNLKRFVILGKWEFVCSWTGKYSGLFNDVQPYYSPNFRFIFKIIH